MAFELVEFSNLTYEQKLVFYDFCKSASFENLPAASNMWNDDWNNHQETLPFILEKTDRFKVKGQFHVLFQNEKIALCGGVYLSDFSKYISIAGTRTWVTKEYRNQALIRDFLLPAHKKWSIDRQCKQVAICFNEYNKNLKKIFYRNRLGESDDRLFTRSSYHLFHSNINELPFTVNIQDTPQWVLYEKIDQDWDFDWYSIKCS